MPRGVSYAPPEWPRPIAIDGEEFKNWQSLVVELKDGPYRNFNICVGNANIVYNGELLPASIETPRETNSVCPTYDLSGRRVSVSSASSVSSVLPKGVYIKDGKKVVVR